MQVPMCTSVDRLVLLSQVLPISRPHSWSFRTLSSLACLLWKPSRLNLLLGPPPSLVLFPYGSIGIADKSCPEKGDKLLLIERNSPFFIGCLTFFL